MPQNKEDLNELLAYRDSHAPWLALKEPLPIPLVKRNLKLLRGLNGSSKITLEELDQLTELEIKDVIAAYKTRPEQNIQQLPIPATAPQFFHSIMAKSPYFSEIISYSGSKSPNSALLSSVQTNPDTSPKNPEPVHGFHLKEKEAFSSTRYYSEDKKSYAQIIAKNGAFEAHHQNLNQEQKIDLAFEISFQFLLNLPPDKKTANIYGSPEEVHRMHAALLYLQKEAGTRYDHIKIQLPEGIPTVSVEMRDAYIKNHLGELNKLPPQANQWRDFLNIGSNAPDNARDITPAPVLQTEKKPLIDMEHVFHAPDLSQEDKAQLNEYQRYLKEVWIDGLKEPDDELMIAEHEEFMQRTESALQLFKKAPSLEKEFEVLKKLYTVTVESHQDMLEALYQNDIEYETQMKELMPKLQKARLEDLEGCLYHVNKHLDTEIRFNTQLSEELKNSLLSHAQAIQEITHLIQGKEELSDEMARSCGTKMLHALNSLESIKDYPKTNLFQQMKNFSKELLETKENTKTQSEKLMTASNNVKDRLNQFKKEFMPPKTSELSLNSEVKEQLETLVDKVNDFIEHIETEDGQSSLKQLTETMQDICNATMISKNQIETLQHDIDQVFPHLQDNHELMQALFEMKTSMEVPQVSVQLSQEPEPDNWEGFSMQ